MSAYGLYCTVCKETFESRESWTSHLLTESHQSSARQACLRWRKKERKCTIVVFSDKPVAEADTLLEYFSMRNLSTIVTDFVWWPDRPRMGLMQFESRTKVKEVLDVLGKPVLQLPDCFVQFKEAVSYLDWEWSELICKGTVNDNFPEEDSESEDRKPKLLENGNLREEQTSTCSSSILASQFSDLCKSTEVTHEEYSKCLAVKNRVRQVAGRRRTHKVYIYNWSTLKLCCTRTPGEFILLIRVQRMRDQENQVGKNFQEIDAVLERKLLNSKSDCAYEFEKLNVSDELKWKLGGNLFISRRFNIRFNITSDPLRNVEIQLGRILDYYFQFDPVIKPLFTLVYFWAEKNEILLAEIPTFPCVTTDSNSSTLLPDSAALNWLVVLFFTKRGIVPTVREILERSQTDSFDVSNPGDIAFVGDPELVEEWRNRNQRNFQANEPDKFIIHVLHLVQDFFEFFHEIWSDGRKLILNPKDGEIYVRNDLFKNQCETKMSKNLANKLQARIRRNKSKRSSKIYIIHPLCFKWRLSVGNKDIKRHAEIIRETASRIKEFVSKCSRYENLHEEKLDLEEALKCPLSTKNNQTKTSGE